MYFVFLHPFVFSFWWVGVGGERGGGVDVEGRGM